MDIKVKDIQKTRSEMGGYIVDWDLDGIPQGRTHIYAEMVSQSPTAWALWEAVEKARKSRKNKIKVRAAARPVDIDAIRKEREEKKRIENENAQRQYDEDKEKFSKLMKAGKFSEAFDLIKG